MAAPVHVVDAKVDAEVSPPTIAQPAVQTVLGVSITPAAIGWVLVDARETDGDTLDYDSFDISSDGKPSGDTVALKAAAHAARAIANSSGYRVQSVGVTWTDDVVTKPKVLLAALKEQGFDDVVSVKLPHATQALAKGIRRVAAHTTTAVCTIAPETVNVVVVDARGVAVKTAVARTDDRADGLVRWLTAVLEQCKPEGLFLVGSQSDLSAITPALNGFPIPLIGSAETKLAFARGAALASTPTVEVAGVAASPASPKPNRTTRQLPLPRIAVLAACIATFAMGLVVLGHIAAQSNSRPPVDIPAAAPPPALAPAAPAPVVAAPPVEAPVAQRLPVAEVPAAAPPAAPTPGLPVERLAGPQPQAIPVPAPVPEEPPVDDPIAAALSPLFGALP